MKKVIELETFGEKSLDELMKLTFLYESNRISTTVMLIYDMVSLTVTFSSCDFFEGALFLKE